MAEENILITDEEKAFNQDAVMKRGFYHVEVFDSNVEKVDERFDILAWNRREAYVDVMNKVKPHKSWDATRIRNHVS
jgi:uncharacterized protein YxeA